MWQVLIAEDEWLIAAALRRQVQQQGVEVVGTVGTGREAVARCRELRPDVVLMDVQMPEMDGVEATRLIMEHCPTCVIVLTALTGRREAAEKAGAMGYVAKPLLPSQILTAIEDARRRFVEYVAIDAMPGDTEGMVEAWELIEAAEQVFVRRGVAPEAARETLKELARGAGVSLRDMAVTIIREGRDDGTAPALVPRPTPPRPDKSSSEAAPIPPP